MNQNILEAKKGLVNEIVEKAKSSKAVVVCHYNGLTVAKIHELRRALRKEGASLCVYKNSLVSRACDELGYKELEEVLSGPNAFIFSDDVVKGPKVVAKYSKKYRDGLVITGAVLEGQFADADTVKEIAKLPGKEGLISMFLSCLQAPVRQFACAVNAIAESK